MRTSSYVGANRIRSRVGAGRSLSAVGSPDVFDFLLLYLEVSGVSNGRRDVGIIRRPWAEFLEILKDPAPLQSKPPLIGRYCGKEKAEDMTAFFVHCSFHRFLMGRGLKPAYSPAALYGHRKQGICVKYRTFKLYSVFVQKLFIYFVRYACSL